MKHLLNGFLITVIGFLLLLSTIWFNELVIKLTGSSLKEWAPLLIIVLFISYILGLIYESYRSIRKD